MAGKLPLPKPSPWCLFPAQGCCVSLLCREPCWPSQMGTSRNHSQRLPQSVLKTKELCLEELEASRRKGGDIGVPAGARSCSCGRRLPRLGAGNVPAVINMDEQIHKPCAVRISRARLRVRGGASRRSAGWKLPGILQEPPAAGHGPGMVTGQCHCVTMALPSVVWGSPVTPSSQKQEPSGATGQHSGVCAAPRPCRPCRDRCSTLGLVELSRK